MTITLPNDLESRVLAAVQMGRFASVDDAMVEAARLLLRELDGGPQSGPQGIANGVSPDPILGCMHADAELMDEIVADVYRQRRDETWRELDL